ncbi:MAG TPA: DUF2934 domain-containing protein [Nitrospira sp.]|nr:DUF2934 domain-containing protein [Nitrospira sp.]
MARARSDKSKNKPSISKEKMRDGQADKGGPTNAEPAGQVLSRNSAQRNSFQPYANPKKRQEQQCIEEPSAELRESEKVSEETLSMTSPTPNGLQNTEDHSTTHRRIAEQAFMLFQESGCEHGNDWSHWFEAERQIKEIRT